MTTIPALSSRLSDADELIQVAQLRTVPGAELSIVVPTFNESGNVAPLVSALDAALPNVRFEVIFVDDDSPDNTARFVKELAQTRADVKCVHRKGRRGLSSAVVEGILTSSSPYVAVMDGDLQHDESVLNEMLEILRKGEADVVVGSRYVAGGSIGDWTSKRAWMSDFAGRLSRAVLKGRELRDPMSGFFMTRRDRFDAAIPALSIEGFKILLDYIASSPATNVIREVPYQFRKRLYGESKLDSLVIWEYGILLIDKLIGHVIPARFVLFALVGGTGVAVHFAALTLLLKTSNLGFVISQLLASVVAMTTNFVLNDALTYRDKRLHGMRWWRGLFAFCLVCSLGAIANVGVAGALFSQHYTWWLAASAGIIVGTIFNYTMTSLVAWNKR